MSRGLSVLIYPHEILRQKAEAVEDFNKSLEDLAAQMLDTMYLYKGIGLAANQVGVLSRIFVLDVTWRDRDDEGNKKVEKLPEIYVNPEIVSKQGSIEYEEGCLSIPKMYGMVKRSEMIEVKYKDLKGRDQHATLSGLRAIAFQHELDHLNGVMFFDHLSLFKRRILLEKFAKMQSEAKKEKE